MRKAQTDIQESVLISPIDGILTRADAKTIGVNVGIATTFTVTDLTTLEFTMEVDEADISKIKTGQNVRIMLDSYSDKTLEIAIASIDFVTHTTSTGGNAYNVKASIEGTNPDYMYRVGMTGNAEIILSEKNDILSVPLSALFETNKVYVETANKKYEKREITLGTQNDIAVEVKEGLSEGEIIVTDPTMVPTKK
jgi:HlyD family secretion protein